MASRATVALTAGLALTAIAVSVTLMGSPLVVAETGAVPTGEELARVKGSTVVCQAGETLPATTTTIRLSLFAVFGPSVSAAVYSKGRLITSGRRGTGWIGEMVTVPVSWVSRDIRGAEICATLGPTDEDVVVAGDRRATPRASSGVHGPSLAGRMRIEYAKRGGESWWSLASGIAARMGVGHTPRGMSLAVLLLVLMAAFVTGACWLALRELR